jgi:translocation and assembly module TamB
MIRHPIFRMSLLAGFFFLLGFSYNYHLPKIETFLLLEVEKLSQKHSPIRVWAQKLHLHLFPLGIVLEDVRLLPQAPIDRYLAPTLLHEAGARLAIWPLLRGEVRLSQVFIRDSELNLFLRPELFESHGGAAKPKISFEEIYRLPIDEILLERVQVQGKIEPQNVVFKIGETNLLIENRYQSLFVELNAPEVLLKPSGPSKPLNASVELRTLVEADEMQVSAFKLKANDSFVVASGRFNGDIAAGHLENGAFDARAKVQLADINSWEQVFIAHPLVPTLSGRAEVDVGMEVRKGKGFKVESELSTDSLQVDKFKFGTIKAHLSSDLKNITADKILVENEALKVQLQKFKMALEPVPSFSAAVNVDRVEVRQLLTNLGVKKTPLLIPAKGEGTCQGSWGEKPQLDCHAKLDVSRVYIYGDPPKKDTIIDVSALHGEGDVSIGLKEMQYKTEIQVGKNSKGRSHGTVNYDTGFKIFYEGDVVDFGDLKSLADLKLEGTAKLDGSTTGTSDWGTIDMNFEAKDFWLENYPFGKLAGRFAYKAGHLNFAGVQGQYGTSQYNGDVGIDLHEKQIQIDGKIPFADLHDVQQIFQRKIDLPFNVAGTGQGQIEAHGPFRFSDMSYKLRSSFYRGEIANENFDELVLNVTSNDGHVQSDRITLTKSTGSAEAKGTISPDGKIDTVVVGRGLRLEQSENVLSMGLDLQGLADFTVLIRGQLPKPRIELNGRLSRVVLADQPAQDSVFKLNFLPDRVEGSGQFLGATILADATIPYTNEAPFVLRVKAKKWDFTNLFSLVSKSARQLDFGTTVTGNINLVAPQGGFWKSSGQVELDEFVLRKGNKSLAAKKPMILNVREGEANSSGFAISNADSYLKLDVAGLTREHLNASVNGKLDLSLLGLFTPFISDLRGNMAVSMDFKGSVEKPQLSGSAYVDKAYAKFNDFVHPFQNVRADLIFNDNQILLNSVQSDLAGGKVSGDGKITFAGKSRPIDVKGSFSDVKLNVPDGFRTHGSGTVAITGNGFPYTMGINYSVVGGEISYEIGDQSGGTNTIKASNYLPHFLSQETFHPFTFNVDATLKNPVAVNNSLASVQVNGHIAATGTPDRLLLNGTITPVPGGKVFFKDTPFEIASAYFEYNDAPPSEPKVFLTANTRVTAVSQDDSGGNGQTRTQEKPYDVNLLIQGKGPTPQIILTSQPPLPQQDIVSLLALGMTTSSSVDEKRATDQSSALAANSSAALGATLLQKAGGKRIKESLGVDLKVSSQTTPDTASQPKVTLSKQWTPKFGASASSTLNANPMNDVKLEYKMNKSISVIGSWTGREYVQEQKDAAKNILGLDLEYKLQFK